MLAAEQRGRLGVGVVGRRDLDEVEAGERLPAQRAQERDRLVRQQAADLGRAGGRRERRVDARRCRTTGTRGRRRPARRRAPRTPPASTCAARRRARSRSPTRAARRGPRPRRASRACPPAASVRVDQPLLERALERRAVEVALAVVLLPRVGVGVEQHDAERPVDGGVRAQLAEHDRVVAAERDRRRAGAHHRLELRGDLRRGPLRVARA